ncbi:MAG: DUF4169 family protein [Rhizomicrobium sp.]|jgi:hypothetical protein
MAEVVNLRRARKAKARRAKEVVAEANRAEHGVSKSAHKLAKKRAEKAAHELEAHRLKNDED